MTKMGRPGEGKAKHGRLRGQVRPELKRQAEELVKRDARFQFGQQAHGDLARVLHAGI